MSDMGDAFREMREAANARKEINEARVVNQYKGDKGRLVRCGIAFEEFSDGRIRARVPVGIKIDFWPSTGTWREVTGNGPSGHGWKALKTELQRHATKESPWQHKRASKRKAKQKEAQ